MKKHFLAALILGGWVLSTPSCKKDDKTTTPTTPAYTAPSNAIAGSVDGTAMPIDAVVVSNQSGSVYVHGSHQGTNNQLAVTVPATATAGTYDAGAFGSYQIVYYSSSDVFAPNSGAGSIVVTSNDTDHKVIKGTFTGTLTSLSGTGTTHTVTGGTFTANY